MQKMFCRAIVSVINETKLIATFLIMRNVDNSIDGYIYNYYIELLLMEYL